MAKGMRFRRWRARLLRTVRADPRRRHVHHRHAVRRVQARAPRLARGARRVLHVERAAPQRRRRRRLHPAQPRSGCCNRSHALQPWLRTARRHGAGCAAPRPGHAATGLWRHARAHGQRCCSSAGRCAAGVEHAVGDAPAAAWPPPPSGTAAQTAQRPDRALRAWAACMAPQRPRPRSRARPPPGPRTVAPCPAAAAARPRPRSRQRAFRARPERRCGSDPPLAARRRLNHPTSACSRALL